MKNLSKVILLAFLGFAVLGMLSSAISAYDFIAHLDRQMHSISCSVIPGLGDKAQTGTGGCYAVMMSPYSSVLRTETWGGIPIALPSFSVFAFLVFLGLDLFLRRGFARPKVLLFAIAAAALPSIVSLVYWFISVTVIGAVCKNCVGIYTASFGSLIAAALAFWLARKDPDPDAPPGFPWRWYALAFAEGVAFVVVPLLVFLAAKPVYTNEMARCGTLMHQEDKYNVRVKINERRNGVEAVELIDPLCPACKAFRDRLEGSGLVDKLDLDAVLFPLDSTCNWMVSESLHPGACTVSEAVLCAGGRANEVLNWALDNQEELRQTAVADPKRLKSRIAERFPEVADCMGRPAVKSRVNKSLRWIISNSSKVMTPQLFVRGTKLCDEDSDLGLEFALTRLLRGMEGGEAKAGRAAAGKEVPR